LVAAAALYLVTGSTAGAESRAPQPGPEDIAFGSAAAPVTLIEYSDFQCNFCAGYAGLLKPLRAEYGDRVRFIFRFFPLSNHSYGMISAQAAYAAHLQGKFWEMHDLLYENQQAWSESSDPRPYFDAYAEYLGLDVDKFRADAQAQSTIDFIEKQQADGERAGVNHTPWFIANDQVVIPRSASDFKQIFEGTPDGGR
jgi:protein-disulfide isomerase